MAPLLQAFILDHDPQAVLDWADQVARWDFERLIPCHFEAPITTTPEAFRQAFAVFESSYLDQETFGSTCAPLPREDVYFIQQLEATLDRWGLTKPPRQRSGQS